MRASLAAQFAVFLIKGYQFFISPLLGQNCRFTPTCSQYALLSISRYGFMLGMWLAVRRLVRCWPWAEGGYDPVPDSIQFRSHLGDFLSKKRIRHLFGGR